MTKPTNKATAFPLHDRTYSFPGMTLRDYFAAKALPGIVEDCAQSDVYGHDFDDCARMAYKLADAMLKAREAVQ